MIYRELNATFGNLNEATLELKEGLNVVYGPNESGKSTWSALIRAMLYGISTREKTKIGFLADKEKYLPWSGAPMYGRLRMTVDGRPICIERKAARTGVLQKAEVTYEDTGLSADLPEPPGETLLGVKREVFDRSALTAQGNLLVSADKEGELARRITSLVQTGDDEATYATTKARLEKWRRARKYNRSGVIPTGEETIERDTRLLAVLRQDAELLTAQLAKKQSYEEEQEKLQRLRAAWKANNAAKKLSEIRAAEQAAKDAESNCIPFPNEQRGEELLALERAYLEAERAVHEKIQINDVSHETIKYGLIGAAAAVLLGGAVGIAVSAWLGAAAAVVGFAVSFGVGFVLGHKKRTQQIRAVQEEREALAQAAKETLEKKLKTFAPTATAADVSAVLERERARVQEARRTQQEAEFAKERLALLMRDVDLAVLTAEAAAAEAIPPELDLESGMRRLTYLEQQIREIELDCAARKARMSERGELAEIEERIEATQAAKEKAEREYDALSLALDTLSEVNGALERRFAPVLEQKAAELLSKITNGHFKTVDLRGAELELSVREHDAAPPRSILSLSGGTLDELYLCLRLAICDTIFDEPVPVILDDVFVNYDDTRLARMLSYLKELAKTRQIILFTCHKRESLILQGDPEVNCISIG